MSFKQAHICHVVASINEDIGGPAYCVANLAQVLPREDFSSYLLTLDYWHHGEQIPTSNVLLHSYPADWRARSFRGFQRDAYRGLYELASTELDLIHNYGLWMFPNLYARQAAIGNHLPLLTSPMGMLETWSLKNSWFKKLPAWFLYERKNLEKATVFHATSYAELRSIRALQFKQPVALVPHGVDLPEAKAQLDRAILSDEFPELADKHWLLFLSRIHPKKGLDNLLVVWKLLSNQFPDWHLIIAGPDLIGYQSQLEKLTAELELESRVTFTGMLTGERKACALSNAELFVLPTHSENFGIAVAESLAHRVPVITTKEAPWQDLERYGCGWWIDDSREALAVALQEAMQLSSQERQMMGAKGRNLVGNTYSWQTIAAEMAKVYQWILGGGEPPDCIHFSRS